MQIYDVIAGAQSGRAIENLAAAAGIAPAQADAALRAVIPEFVKGLERNTLSRGGLADLVAALGQGHHELILETPQALGDPRVADDGNAILGHILGSRDRSRAVALQAARASGLSDSLIQMLLPYLAQMLMGAIAKWAKGGLGDVINKLPGGGGQGGGMPFPGGAGRGFELPRGGMPEGGFPMPPMPGGDSQSGGIPQGFPMPGPGTGDQRPGGGYQMPWPRDASSGNQPSAHPLPLPGGGERRGGGFGQPDIGRPEGGYPMPPMPDAGAGQSGGYPLPSPLPQSGANNPYGDLSDVLRRGGSVGGSPIGGIVRNIFGSLLGFQSKGVMSWIIRLIVVRFGWGLVKRLLSRVLMGGR